MKVFILALCIFVFVGSAFAKDVYIDRPDRNYSPSKSVWNPDPGEKVYMCIGCMVKIKELDSGLWKIIAFNGMTYHGGVPTLNFDLCYFQKDVPDCMDIFIVKQSNLTGHVFAIRFFKFKILKIDNDALHLEFLGFMDDEETTETEVTPMPDSKKSQEEEKGSDL